MMERLTQSGITYNFAKLDLAEIRWLEDVQKRLAYYEDMEEQGRLVVLPCKVGDTLYYAPEWYARCDYGPEPISVEEVNSYSGTIVVECYLDPDTRVSVNTWDFGKTVFLTREDAERALKEGADHEHK